MHGEDICEVVLECLWAKGINTTHLVSVATDGAPSMTGVQKGFVAFLQKTLDRKLLDVLLHLTSRGTVCSNISPRMHASNECGHSNYQ